MNMNDSIKSENDELNAEMLKPISWLLDKNFYVPKYQRGYRWTAKQVVDLLDDIAEFSDKGTNEEFYCLQPIVVKKNGNKWNLIDGQQRLTTIILLVKYFNEMWIGKQKLPIPALEYETREESKNFIENLEIDNSKAKSSESTDSNIDFFHIAKAYEAINKWVENKTGDFDNSKFQSTFLHHTKVIWYELETKEDEISSFIRINSGKIPLTNAELIKALFLQKKNFSHESDMTIHRYEMSEDWDRIEHKLQENSFWYFLTKNAPTSFSRIEIIFDLIYEKETGKKKQKDEPLTTYLFFVEKSKSPEWNITEQWNQIKNIFDTLCEWYADYERYHCIGYLIYTGKKIQDLYKLCYGLKKDESLMELKKLMLESIPNGLDGIDKIDYDQQSPDALRKFYVLYNILYLLKNKGSYKFPFDKLKTEKWDIEHIDSKTENPLENLKDQIEWLEYTYSDLKDDLKDLKDEIDEYKKLEKVHIEQFSSLYKKIINRIVDSSIQNKNSIGNLTLLDSHTNRAYGNSLFPTKRRFIIERDKAGLFIPPCTKNVFLKYYQTGTADLRKWTAQDELEYRKDIVTTFLDFFNEVR